MTRRLAVVGVAAGLLVRPARHRRRDHHRARADLGGRARSPHGVGHLADHDPPDRRGCRRHLRGGARRRVRARGERRLRRRQPRRRGARRARQRPHLRAWSADGARARAGVFGLRLAIPLGFGPGTDTWRSICLTVVWLLVLGLNGGFMAGLLGVGGGAIAIAVMVFALGDEPGAGSGDRPGGDDPDRDRWRAAAPAPGHARGARRSRGRRRGDGDRHPWLAPGLRAPGRPAARRCSGCS